MIVRLLPARAREFFSSCKFRVLAAFTKKSVSGPDERDISWESRLPIRPVSKKPVRTDPCLPGYMGDRTARGDLLIADAGAAAAATGYAALFADLTVIGIALFGISLACVPCPYRNRSAVPL